VPERRREIILLTDGLENTAPFWDMGPGNLRRVFERPENADVAIHSVALGAHTDRDLHARISAVTGGEARFVYLGSSLSLFGRLADAYMQLREISLNEMRLFTLGEDIPLDAPKIYEVDLPEGARTTRFAISYRDPQADIGLSVFDPTGGPLSSVDERIEMVNGVTSIIVTVVAPTPGRYRLEVTSSNGDIEVLTTVSAKLDVFLDGRLSFLRPSGASDMSGVLYASVLSKTIATASNQPVSVDPDGFLAAKPDRVVALVTAPDKSVVEISLTDDGAHRDGSASDGVYAASVLFDQGGPYAIRLRAYFGAGADAPFIERSLGVFQARSLDVDLDGMTDDWELASFPGRTIDRIHPLADVDFDGLSNFEEFRYRTNPLLFDTDGDGAPDGAEVWTLQDPTTAGAVTAGPNDADADWLDDDWERDHFGRDPRGVSAADDPDEDGLTNYAEFVNTTNPTLWDSNGNGVNDGEEAQWRTPQPRPGWRLAAAVPTRQVPVIDWYLYVFLAIALVGVGLLFRMTNNVRGRRDT
jgi:hypothetical protein